MHHIYYLHNYYNILNQYYRHIQYATYLNQRRLSNYLFPIDI